MILEDLVPIPFTELPDAEALSLVIKLRESRLISKRSAPAPKSKTVKETTINISAMTNSLTGEGAAELLALLLSRRKKS
jgi:hypothetical protein